MEGKRKTRGKEKRKRYLLHLLLIYLPLSFQSLLLPSLYLFLYLPLSLRSVATARLVLRHLRPFRGTLERERERERKRASTFLSPVILFQRHRVGESPFISLALSFSPSFFARSFRTQGPVCHLSPCPTHHRASLWILRASAAFSLSLSLPWMDDAAGVCAPRTLPDGGHVADHGGGAKGTSWELYQPSRTQLNFNRFASAALFPSLNSLSLTDLISFSTGETTQRFKRKSRIYDTCDSRVFHINRVSI